MGGQVSCAEDLESKVREKEEELVKGAVQQKKEAISHVAYGYDEDKNFVINIKSAATGDYIYQIVISLQFPRHITWKEVVCMREALKFAERGRPFTKSAFISWQTKAAEYGTAVIEEKHKSIVMKIQPKRVNNDFSAGHIRNTHIEFTSKQAIVSFSTDVERYKMSIDHVKVNESFARQQIEALADALLISEPGDKMDDSMFLHFASQLNSKYNFVSLQGRPGSLELQIHPHPLTPEQCRIEFISPIPIPPRMNGRPHWSNETEARVKQVVSQSYHHGITCDGCGKEEKSFTGRRFKCQVCQNFDLCQECFNASLEFGSHLSSHAMKPIDAPEGSPTKLDRGAADLLAQLLIAVVGDELSPLQRERLNEERVFANADVPDGAAVVSKWLYGIDRQKNFIVTVDTIRPEKQYLLAAILKDSNNITAKEAEVIKLFLKFAERGTQLREEQLKALALVMLTQGYEDVSAQGGNNGLALVVKGGGTNEGIPPGHVRRLQLGTDSDKDMVLKFNTDVEEYILIVNQEVKGNSMSKLQGNALNDALKICEPGMKMDDSIFLFYCAQLQKKYNLLRVMRKGGILAAYMVPTNLAVGDAGVKFAEDGDVRLPPYAPGQADWSEATKRRLEALGGRDGKKNGEEKSRQCSVCPCDLVGLHYRCSDCPNYFVCKSCFDLGKVSGSHDRSHSIVVVSDYNNNSQLSTPPAAGPRDAPAKKEVKCHLNIRCNGCKKKNFTTKRYQCVECDNFNLCQDCYEADYEEGDHSSNHDFSLITPKDRLPAAREAKSSDELPVIDGGRIVGTALIKKSGQATVYKGYMKEDNGKRSDVCIKLYHSHDDWKDLMKEAMSVIKIPEHPNVISVIAFFPDPLPSLIMPLIEGCDLFDLLQKKGAMSTNNALTIMRGIGQGLQHLHNRKIVHRDMKSLNVMIETQTYRAVLIDLGMGKSTNRESIQHTVCPKGTLLWMAPEMLKEGGYSYKTDIYAVGIIMWEVFSGKVPYHNVEFSRLPWYVVQDKGRPQMQDVANHRGMTGNMSTLMQRCWDHNPDSRPTADEFLRMLDNR